MERNWRGLTRQEFLMTCSVAMAAVLAGCTPADQASDAVDRVNAFAGAAGLDASLPSSIDVC